MIRTDFEMSKDTSSNTPRRLSRLFIGTDSVSAAHSEWPRSVGPDSAWHSNALPGVDNPGRGKSIEKQFELISSSSNSRKSLSSPVVPCAKDILAKAVKQGKLQRRLTGNGVVWKDRLVVLTKENFCTFNEHGELCEFIDLVEFVSCRLYEQVPVLLAALFSNFYQ